MDSPKPSLNTKGAPSRLWTLHLLLFLALAPCYAQNADKLELDPFGGVSLFSGFSPSDVTEKFVNGGTAGGRAAYNFSEYFGLEGSYNFSVNNVRLATPGNFSSLHQTFGNQIQSFSINPVFNFTRRGSRVRPYITAGVGPNWYVPTKQARAQFSELGKSAEVAFNYGAGIKYHLSSHLGLRLDARGILAHNPTFGIPSVSDFHLNSLQATAGLMFYFWQPHPPPPAVVAPLTEVKQTLQPLNPGEITGAQGKLCQGRVLTLHATATDPAGHTLSYKWKANGTSVGSDNPDLSFKPNNAGDFEFEVEVTDASDMARTVRVGPKTLSIQDYVQPKIAGLTASPNSVTISPELPPNQTVILAADIISTPCGGNLTYKWNVSEGALTNAAGPSAVFETSSLNFDSGLGQTKTITATLTATDETGQTATQNVSFVVDYPSQFKRLPDVVFAKDSARVNNCGKRILIEQAAPQAGTAFEILLVGHRGADERESVPSPGRNSVNSSTLDRQRLFSVAAVLTGNHGICGNLDLSQVRLYAAGTEQISPLDPGFCGTSTIPHTAQRMGASVSNADNERRVELYLLPKGIHVLPPAARNAAAVESRPVKALGCPK